MTHVPSYRPREREASSGPPGDGATPTAQAGPSMEGRKVALVHDWIEQIGGGERVVESLLGAFPQADLFTLFYDPRVVEGSELRHCEINASLLQRLPGIGRWYRYALPVLPLAIETFDVASYDIVISSSSSVAKGVITSGNQLHVSYVHSPARYVWDSGAHYPPRGMRRLAPVRVFEEWAKHRFRIWDRSASVSPDYLVANSSEVARRIRRAYGRPSEIIYPPVRVHEHTADGVRGDFLLYVGRLVPYKRVDLIVRACEKVGQPLVIVGTGPELPVLRKLAGPNTRLLGRVSDEEVRGLLASCKAFCYPGVEDFGIAMVEAQAAGAPVIAPRAGGALDILPGGTGVFMEDQSVDGFLTALRTLERDPIDPHACRSNAMRFGVDRFQKEMLALTRKGLLERGNPPQIAGPLVAGSAIGMDATPARLESGSQVD
jgi:glycosyltransferase involved in cell wall biosynthesis